VNRQQSLLWMMLVSLSLGCRNSTQTPDSSSLNLQDGSHVRVVEPEDLIPKDGSPLVFPPGTFDWQPEGLSIVVHTAYNAYYGYPQPNLEATRAYKNCGLNVRSYASYDTENELGFRNRQVKWIAFDVDKFNYNDALHFFEIYAAHSPNPRNSSEGPFTWKLGDDVWVSSQHTSGVKMCIPSDNPSAGNVYKQGEPPRVSQEWLDYIEEVETTEVKGELFVWYPEDNTITRKNVVVTFGQGIQWPYQHGIAISVEGDL